MGFFSIFGRETSVSTSEKLEKKARKDFVGMLNDSTRIHRLQKDINLLETQLGNPISPMKVKRVADEIAERILELAKYSEDEELLIEDVDKIKAILRKRLYEEFDEYVTRKGDVVLSKVTKDSDPGRKIAEAKGILQRALQEKTASITQSKKAGIRAR